MKKNIFLLTCTITANILSAQSVYTDNLPTKTSVKAPISKDFNKRFQVQKEQTKSTKVQDKNIQKASTVQTYQRGIISTH